MDAAHRCVRFPKFFYARIMFLVSYLTMSLGVFQLTRFAAMLEAINLLCSHSAWVGIPAGSSCVTDLMASCTVIDFLVLEL